MSRKPSDKTLLAHARREIKELNASLKGAWHNENNYRVRATKAEQEAAEWKARFDRLLDFRRSVESATVGKSVAPSNEETK